MKLAKLPALSAVVAMLAASFILCSPVLMAQKREKPRDLLASQFTAEQLPSMLQPAGTWRPFPALADRQAWAQLPDSLAQALVAKGEAALGYRWPSLPATLYLEYVRNNNRSRFESAYFERRGMLNDLLLAELAEGKGRFTDQIANGIWAICEETSWCIPAHLPEAGLPDPGQPVVDLFAAETGMRLAWADYFMGEQLNQVSPLVRQRLRQEVSRQVLRPALEEEFWWMGFGDNRVNNWNPWIASNWLVANLLLEEDADRRSAATWRAMQVLDNFINSYPDDGGCDEGPGYWGHAGGSLFDALETLYSATEGKINVYDREIIKNMGLYLPKAHIANRYFINFADASARINVYGSLVYRYGKRIGDPGLAAFGAYFWQNHRHQASSRHAGTRQFYELLMQQELASAAGNAPLLQDVWLPELEFMATRDQQGSSRGLFLAAKGGHNNESHNHNDVGSFLLYVNGHPALVDAGAGTYTRRTFSSERYDIWYTQSHYHNLPTINGHGQQAGRQFAAKKVRHKANRNGASFSLDIAGAYPPEAGVKSWNRELKLLRGQAVMLEDKFQLERNSGLTAENFLTSCQPVLAESGELRLKSRGEQPGQNFMLFINYDPAKLKPEIEEVLLNTEDDGRLKSIWGEKLYRVRFKSISPVLKDTWRMLFSIH